MDNFHLNELAARSSDCRAFLRGQTDGSAGRVGDIPDADRDNPAYRAGYFRGRDLAVVLDARRPR